MITFSQQPSSELAFGRFLTGRYVRVLLWYFLGMLLCWGIGVEAIYDHATPFYALFAPAFPSVLIPGTILWLVGLTYWLVSTRWVQRGGPRRLWGWGLLSVGALILLGGVAYQARATTVPTEYWRTFWHSLGGHVGVFLLFLGGYSLALYGVTEGDCLDEEHWRGRRLFLLLSAIMLFSFLFACTLAMLRGGFLGIYRPYLRESYEYVGDIGKTTNIRQLFSRYTTIQPFLSMHGKVHPPGPIALLWSYSYLVGRSPQALALATTFTGALAIFPLYGWLRTCLNHRVALLACLIYPIVPSIALFSATSADVLFTPFTLTTLFFFERAIRHGKLRDAVAAGLCYGVLCLLKFTLIGIGVYFAWSGLRFLLRADLRRNVIQTAVVMVFGVLTVLLGVWLWSGFNIIECFHLANARFQQDLHELSQFTPRLPRIWYPLLINPAAWFYFAGIPVSLLFLYRLFHPATQERGLFWVFALTLLSLNALYLALGEGERSSLYLHPFLVATAVHVLADWGERQPILFPLASTLGFLGFQCWLTETYFYTYW